MTMFMYLVFAPAGLAILCALVLGIGENLQGKDGNL